MKRMTLLLTALSLLLASQMALAEKAELSSPDGKIKRFHQGAFGIADMLDLEVQPLIIHGAYDALPKTEHFLNRSFCSGMAEALELIDTDQPDGWEAFSENARAYLALLLHHVCKEDHQFFPWCQERLSSENAESLLQKFIKTAKDDFAPEFTQLWVDKIARLKDKYGESAEVIAACD